MRSAGAVVVGDRRSKLRKFPEGDFVSRRKGLKVIVEEDCTRVSVVGSGWAKGGAETCLVELFHIICVGLAGIAGS